MIDSAPSMSNGGKPSKDQIVAMLAAGVRQAVGYGDSRLARERVRMHKYRDGELPVPLHPGNSKYVSMDVYDGVESMKAQLLEVFSGSAEPVVFAARGPDDVKMAKEATSYVNYVIFRQNQGFKTFRSVIDDGLMGRAGIAKVWWQERIEEDTFYLTDTNFEQLKAHLMDNPAHTPVKVEWEGPEGSAIKRVEMTVKRDKSRVHVEPLPPEEFFIAPRAVSLHDNELCGHRHRMTRSELLKEGYKKSDIQDLWDDSSLWLSTEPELVERFQQTDDVISADVIEGQQDARKTILVYECYTELDMNGDGKSRLYQIMYAGNKILRMEPVNRRPFVAFVPLPRQHAFWGTNFSKLLVDIQNVRTALMRSIVDHALITTNPRLMVVNSAVKNPRELMENRIGGLVNVTRPDGIIPLPQAPLNPFVFQTIASLDEDKEERIGISRLSQGLNKDAISKQNSADMVEQLVSISQVRQKIVAREFAEGFLTDLFLEVYRLVLENESSQKIIQIAGDFQAVDPTAWPERDDLIVNFALGYGEQEKEGAKYATLDKTLSADPRLARMYPEALRYQVISRAIKKMGIDDVTLINPATLPPPPPDPMQQAELAAKQADGQIKQAQAQAATARIQLEQAAEQNKFNLDMRKLELEAQKERDKVALERAKLELEAQKERDQITLERDKLAHKVAVDAAQINMQREAAASDKLTAEAMPTR